ncbi:Zinc finger, RanBP2-type [Artemisia annua]|uniref:Zinc finger, RanBP2-type n=1 Tax=Artemisia annua TaxID=35608 RepID=A0A2U1L4F6_ARTAN|nr:Zinc finger, RanBP2-type [Artemisia annua]
MSRPGDWNCRSCQHLNFQRRETCQRCGEMRLGGGVLGGFGTGFGGRESMMNPSVFGFTGPDVRPGDWYCSVGNCGAHNFASRSSCFKCGVFKDDLASSGGGFHGDLSHLDFHTKVCTIITTNHDMQYKINILTGLAAMSIISLAEWNALDAMHHGTLVASLPIKSGCRSSSFRLFLDIMLFGAMGIQSNIVFSFLFFTAIT